MEPPVNAEEEWYDLYVRLPLGQEANADTDVAVPLPDRTDTFTYIRPSALSVPVEDPFCRLVIGSYAEDTELTVLSSGLVVWDASVHLCRHLLDDPDLCRAPRVLELGSGTGKAGLLAHRLRRRTPAPPPAYRRMGEAKEPEPPRPPLTMLTDGDVNALANLRRNVWDNTPPDDDGVVVRQLIWGRDSARSFRQYHGKFDYVFGSDLLYSNSSVVQRLFQTVNEVLADGGKFVMVHSVRQNVSLKTALQIAKSHRLLYEVIDHVGEMYVLVFTRMEMANVGPLLDRLHCANDGLRKEINELRLANAGLDDRTRCLEERIVELRGDVQFNIIRLDEDVFIGVSAFLDTPDLAKLATTCRHFGLKTHRIRPGAGRLVSLVERIAYSEYSTANDEEKRCLSVYNLEDDSSGHHHHGTRSVLFYRDELVELRKPLVFDQILGRGLSHSFEDRASLVSANICRIKRTVSSLRFSR